MTCRQCTYMLVPSANPETQYFLMRGFCSKVCHLLWEEEKDYTIERMEDGK